jgi:predicted RNase H-like nuclease (RuvC/YqgF family)
VKRLLFSLIVSGLTLSGLSAIAQDRDRDDRSDRDNRYRDDDRYHGDARDQNSWQNRLFERVRSDIDHIQSMTSVFSGDQFRLTRTKQELNELQSKAMSGSYDDREVDDVINALQRVVGENRLSDRDRDMLRDDLNRLREFREHHDRYYRRG